MGDPVSRDQTNHLTINGQTFADEDPATTAPVSSTAQQGDFDGFAATAIVSDGYLTLTIPGQVTGVSSRNPRLCFIEIGAEGSSVDDALRERLADLIDQANKLTGGQWRSIRPQRTYVYGSYIDEPVMLAVGPKSDLKRYWLHSDHVYSVNAVTDAAGVVVERYAYDAYGERTIFTGDGTQERAQSYVHNDVGFTGRWHDDETGLQFFRARYFSAELGRFISRDSAGYVNGYGLYGAYFVPGATDPSGHQKACTEDIGSGMSLGSILMLGLFEDAVSYGITDDQPSVYHSAMAAYRYMGYDEDSANRLALSWQGMSSPEFEDAKSPMFFLSEDFSGRRDMLLNQGRIADNMAIARRNQMETVNELYDMAMTDLVPAAMMGIGGVVANPVSMLVARASGTAIMAGRGIWGFGQLLKPIVRLGRMVAPAMSRARAYVEVAEVMGEKVLYTGALQKRAQALVEDAARAMGYKLSDLVDDIVSLKGEMSFAVKANGRRIIGIAEDHLALSREGALRVALHELNHARQSAIIGHAKYLQMYQNPAMAARIERLVDSRAGKQLEKILGSLSQDMIKSLADYQAMFP
jgi:RHS repeat-associated protein